jgi:hypothetical protein
LLLNGKAFDGHEETMAMRAALTLVLFLSACSTTLRAAPDLRLLPQEYRLQMTAEKGPKVGVTAGGLLTLRQASADDRSPLGQIAKDNSPPKFWGWTDIQLQDLGVPISSDGPEPHPSSRDPVSPGVLVTVGGWVPDGLPPEAPVLWIASLMNLRADPGWADGGGIVLYTMARNGKCLTGTWKESGMHQVASGSFSVCPQ